MEDPSCGGDDNGKTKPISSSRTGALHDIPLDEEKGEGVEARYSEVVESNRSGGSSGSSGIIEKSQVVNGRKKSLSTSSSTEEVNTSYETFEDSCRSEDLGDVLDIEVEMCLGIARTLCILLTLLILLITGTGIGLALFPRTRFWSLALCLPLLALAILSWIALMCFVSSDDVNDPIAVIETTNLPPPTPVRTKTKDTNLSLSPTIAASDSTDIPPEQSLFERSFPETHRTFSHVSQSIDETKDYILRRVVKPAASLCRPISPTQSIGAKDLSSRSIVRVRSLKNALSFKNVIYGPDDDVECCTDVHCLRDENGVVNLSGKYKLVHNENFDQFLKALEIPALFRRAANAARPVHKYTHNGDTFRVQIEGIIKGDTTFTVYGPPTESTLKNNKFLDYVSYLEDKDGIVVRKVLQNRTSKGSDAVTELIVTRKLSKSGKKLYLISEAVQEDGVIRSTSVQTFLRI